MIRSRLDSSLLLCVALVLCCVLTMPVYAHQADREGGTMTVGLKETIDTLDTYNSGLDVVLRIIGLVCETLFVYDTDLQPQPHLVKTWSVSEDQLTWTFHLKEGISFHDGTPLTAETIAESLRLLFAEYWNAWQFATVEEVNVVDTYTFEFVLSKPYPTLHYYLADPWNVLEPVGAREAYGDRYGFDALVGTGPYVFKEWVRGERIVLERNNDYNHGPAFLDNQGPAYFDTIIFRPIPEAGTRAAELEHGNVDLANMLAESLLPDVLKNPELNSLLQPSPWVIFLGCNMQNPVLQDVRVRRALSYAIDRQAILDAAFNGIGDIAYGLVPPTATGYWPGVKEFASEYRRFDPEKAKQLLEEAGWVDTNGNGIVDKDGQELKLKFLASTVVRYGKPAEVIQYLLPKVGIDVELEVYDIAAAIDKVTAGDFDITVLGWKYVIGPVFLTSICHSTSIPFPNAYRYNSPSLDIFIEEGTNGRTEEERSSALAIAQKMVVADSVVIPLVVRGNSLVAKKRIGGLDALNRHPWWLDLALGLELYIEK